MALDMAGAGYLPSVDLYGKLYFDDPHLSYDWDRKNWTAAVLLNWEFFSGFITRAEQRKASATLDEMMAVDRKSVLNVKLEVKTAYLNLEAARTRLAVARQSVASAEESLKLVKLQYEGGSATITRYLEAELDRNRAKMRATTAFYDQEKALYEIGRAIGYWHAEN
jgi:outer membrane protein TolC